MVMCLKTLTNFIGVPKPWMWVCVYSNTHFRVCSVTTHVCVVFIWIFKWCLNICRTLAIIKSGVTVHCQVSQSKEINGTYKPVIFRPPQTERPTVSVTIPTDVLRHASLTSASSILHQEKNYSFPVRTIIFVQNTPSLFPADNKAPMVSRKERITSAIQQNMKMNAWLFSWLQLS